MRRALTGCLLLLATALPAAAQNWSFGAATGPFVFGDFVDRRLRLTNADGPGEPITMTITAATRPGLALDLERSFSDRWAMRLEGTFARAPLKVEQRGATGNGTEIDAGKLDVSTWMLPVVFRINPRGAVRFHLMGGPAFAVYHARARDNVEGAEPAFAGTKAEWGWAAGGGIAWWVSERFAVEGNITEIMTGSPFERDQFPDVPGIDIRRPKNIHTTAGLRWRF
jgi:opacity protein-like surface antigen